MVGIIFKYFILIQKSIKPMKNNYCFSSLILFLLLPLYTTAQSDILSVMDLKYFEFSELGFKIKLPHEPTLSVSEKKGGKNKDKLVKNYDFDAKGGDSITYKMNVITTHKAEINADSSILSDKKMKDIIKKIDRQLFTKVTSVRDTIVYGCTGKIIQFNVLSSIFYTTHIYVNREFAYMLMLGTEKKYPSKVLEKAFLGSFRLLKE
jgi:hypothetical protein